ncbi:beta strand repeat-containing protein [Cyanobium sp. ATX-6F1]|uniref:beta strand repeat-containing protein n=1 Tax=Cyanobium sp. ATX-6F1 TaxID=3137388 RepID=UPI0039BE84F4
MAPSIALRHAIGLWALILAGGPVVAGEVSATGGALGLGTAVNGQLGGSCGLGLCQVGGGTAAGRNLFHRFSAFDTRGGITGVNFSTGGAQNVFVGVTSPLGSFIDKLVSFSSPGNLFWLSPGGIAISGAGGFANIQQLNLSTATGWRVGNGVFDAAGTTAGQAALLSGAPVSGLAGAVNDPATLAALGIQKNGDLSIAGGLLTVDQGLLLDAQGGNVLLQAARLQAKGGSVEIQGQSVRQDAPIESSGTSGGSVTINAAGALTNGAPIQANGSSAGGTINLQAGTSLTSSSAITATGTGPMAKGGTIELTAPSVTLAAAQVDASGAGGGGVIRVGGGVQGSPLSLGGANAINTMVDSSSSLKADTTQAGNGGQVVVWAERATLVDGAISARGGPAGGDGGFVETSGREQLAVSRAPDASAPLGKGGTWLLDPNNLTVNASGPDSNVSGFPNATTTGDSAVIAASTINAALNAGTSVSLATSAGGAQAGDITVSAPISKTAGGAASLSLSAHNNINLNANISSLAGALNLNLVANSDNVGGGSVQRQTSGTFIDLNGGNLNLAGNGDFTLIDDFRNLRFDKSGTGSYLAPFFVRLTGVTIGTDMTFSNEVGIVNDLLLANGVTVNKEANIWRFGTTGLRTLGLAPGATSATVISSGGFILAGQGVIGQTLTIGPGVTLQSSGAGTTQLRDSTASTIINNGTIASTTGGTWSILPAGFINNGAVTANNGTVSISSTSWSNGSTGVFNVGPSGTLNLGGTFTNANPGASNRTGGSVFIPGTFDLAGATLDVGSAGLFGSGGLTQLSGTLLGGTLINTDTTPVLTSGLGTLNGMTIGSNVGINGTLRIANDLLLTNGVTVNKGANNWNFVTTGVRTLGLAPGASSATVSSSGGAIFAGSGVSGQTLTIGPGVTLQSSGAGTTTLTNSSAAPIINNGTIASTTGGTWSITPTSFHQRRHRNTRCFSGLHARYR